MGVPEVVDMEESFVFFEHVEGIMAISLPAFAPINLAGSVSIEHCPRSIPHPKLLCKPLSDAVDVLAIYFCAQLDVLVAKNELFVEC